MSARTRRHYHGNRAVRLFAGDLLSCCRAAFCARRVARTAATPQRTPPAYKFSETVLQSLLQILQGEPTLLAVDLLQRLQQDLGLWVHPRSIERALIHARKKVCPCQPRSLRRCAHPLSCSTITKLLRCQALQANNSSLERILLEKQGLVTWMQFVPSHVPISPEPSLPLSADLVQVQANLVIGSRREGPS